MRHAFLEIVHWNLNKFGQPKVGPLIWVTPVNVTVQGHCGFVDGGGSDESVSRPAVY